MENARFFKHKKILITSPLSHDLKADGDFTKNQTILNKNPFISLWKKPCRQRSCKLEGFKWQVSLQQIQASGRLRMSCLWAAPVCICAVRGNQYFAILVPSPLRIPLVSATVIEKQLWQVREYECGSVHSLTTHRITECTINYQAAIFQTKIRRHLNVRSRPWHQVSS